MPTVPCSNCRRTDQGKLYYVYLQHFVADDLVRTRGRLCRDCRDGILGDYFACCEERSPRGEWLTVEERS